MPEIKNATGILSQIARPVDNIGLSFLKRAKKRQVIKRVIFGIGILNTDIITPGREKACAKCSPFPFIFSCRTTVTSSYFAASSCAI